MTIKKKFVDEMDAITFKHLSTPYFKKNYEVVGVLSDRDLIILRDKQTERLFRCMIGFYAEYLIRADKKLNADDDQTSLHTAIQGNIRDNYPQLFQM